MSWDPAQYLKYASERLRPALDLLARMPVEAPRYRASIWAAAPGTSRRFSRDALAATRASSASTIRRRCWRVGAGVDRRRDASASGSTPISRPGRPTAPVDVVFSNAALHWHDDHARCSRGSSAGSRRAARSRSRCPTSSPRLRTSRSRRSCRDRDAGAIGWGRCCGARRWRRPPSYFRLLAADARSGRRVDDGISACAAAGRATACIRSSPGRRARR